MGYHTLAWPVEDASVHDLICVCVVHMHICISITTVILSSLLC